MLAAVFFKTPKRSDTLQNNRGNKTMKLKFSIHKPTAPGDYWHSTVAPDSGWWHISFVRYRVVECDGNLYSADDSSPPKLTCLYDGGFWSCEAIELETVNDFIPVTK